MDKTSSKTTLTELMHLDAPLVVAEITNYGETIKNLPWAKEPFSIHPYCVFERKDGVLYYWYDQKGMDWKIEQAGQFDETILIKKIQDAYAEVEDIIKNEKQLEKQEFIDFISKIKEFWVWFDGMWWMIEYKDKKGLDTENLMKARKNTEYFMPGFIATIRNTFAHLVPSHKKYVDVLLIDEVLNNTLPGEDILEARIKTYAYTDEKLFNSLDEVKTHYALDIEEKQNFEGNELKGQVAYPGKVQGEVKIIKTREDMKKFNKGDIIVSPTTTPDFMPIMKICSAIISEHGGVICHAAITSRELKIPCIVGVKGATRILKDGDMVEVDAEKGVIKLLNQ